MAVAFVDFSHGLSCSHLPPFLLIFKRSRQVIFRLVDRSINSCDIFSSLDRHPWPGMDNTWTAIFHIAKASSGPPIPDEISDIVKDFLAHCFQLDPKKRPTSTEVTHSQTPSILQQQLAVFTFEIILFHNSKCVNVLIRPTLRI